MDFIPPYDQVGVVPPGPWTNAAPQAGTKGSIVNANVFPAVQNEILNVQDEAGITRDSTNFAQLLQAIRSGKLTFFVDTGTADAIVVTPRTSFVSLSAGVVLTVLKGASPNATTTPHLTVSGLTQTIVKENGSPLAAGDLPGGSLFTVRGDGTNLRVTGLRKSDAATTVGASTNGGLGVDGSGNLLLNTDNLPVCTTFNVNDKVALFTEESENGLASGKPCAATLGPLAAFFSAQTPGQKLGTAAFSPLAFTSSTTWTCPANCYRVFAEVWAPGGPGASVGSGTGGAGGGGGEYRCGVFTVVPGTTYTLIISTPAAPGSDSGVNSFDAFMTAMGGKHGSGQSSPGAGGSGGFGGTFSEPGNPGAPGYSSGSYIAGAPGGNALGSSNSFTATGSVTGPGVFPGGGGSGGNQTTGSTGAGGQIKLTPLP